MPRQWSMRTNVGVPRAYVQRYRQRSLANARRVTEQSLERMHAIALSLCPYDVQELDDFHMIEHLKGELDPSGLGYSVGFDAADFIQAGQEPYFIYTEFGTSKMAAQPCVFPARDQELPRYRRELRNAVKP